MWKKRLKENNQKTNGNNENAAEPGPKKKDVDSCGYS